MPHRRPKCLIRVRLPHQRPTCHTGDRLASLETDMPQRRPTYMPHWRPTSLIGDRIAHRRPDIPQRRPTSLFRDRHESSENDKPHRRRTCLIGTKLPHRRLIGYAWSSMSVFNGSQIRHVGIWSGILFSDVSPIRHASLQWISDNNIKFINYLNSTV